jgi:fructose-bisphosphate aldolase class II
MMKLESRNLFSLKQLLETAQRNSFAVEAFSPRNTPMIRAILQAGESTRSPLIVQVAQVEFQWYQLSIEEFARQFWLQFDGVCPTVPVGLHLDHTSDFNVIEAAVNQGFTS